MKSKEVEPFRNVFHQCRQDVSYYCTGTLLSEDQEQDYEYEYDEYSADSLLLDLDDFGTAIDAIAKASTSTSLLEDHYEEDGISYFLAHLYVASWHSPPDGGLDRRQAEYVSHKLALLGEGVLDRRASFEEQQNQNDDGDSSSSSSSSSSSPITVEMARRLTEITPEELVRYRPRRRLPLSSSSSQSQSSSQPSPFLPFPCERQNLCLERLFEQRLVSPECGQAVGALYEIRSAQQHRDSFRQQRLEQQEYYQCLYLVAMYGFLFLTVWVLIKKRRARYLATRDLKQQIIRAVYSRPDLKARIEKEIGGNGRTLGFVPPLPRRALAKFGARSRQNRNRRWWNQPLKAFRYLFVIGSGAVLYAAPTYYLPACSCVSAAMFLYALICKREDDDDAAPACECCCCGATTRDAQDGALTKVQACCCCCKGTGVCSPSCAECCGGGGAGGRSRSSSSKSTKAVQKKTSKQYGAYVPPPIKIQKVEIPKTAAKQQAPTEPTCTCCCCGATSSPESSIPLTDAQACCNCCKGTGVCTPACAKCCGGSGGCCCCSGDEGGCCCKPNQQALTEPTCTCCCCGATSKAGIPLTDAQACCNCCKGTGVCTPACAKCCGGGDGGGCCCCGGDKDGCCCETSAETPLDTCTFLRGDRAHFSKITVWAAPPPVSSAYLLPRRPLSKIDAKGDDDDLSIPGSLPDLVPRTAFGRNHIDEDSDDDDDDMPQLIARRTDFDDDDKSLADMPALEPIPCSNCESLRLCGKPFAAEADCTCCCMGECCSSGNNTAAADAAANSCCCCCAGGMDCGDNCCCKKRQKDDVEKLKAFFENLQKDIFYPSVDGMDPEDAILRIV